MSQSLGKYRNAPSIVARAQRHGCRLSPLVRMDLGHRLRFAWVQSCKVAVLSIELIQNRGRSAPPRQQCAFERILLETFICRFEIEASQSFRVAVRKQGGRMLANHSGAFSCDGWK